MGKRVAVLDPNGVFGTIDEADVDKLPENARVLSAKDVAQRALREEYEARSTLEKAGGVLSSSMVAGPIVANAAAASGKVAVQPEVEAFESKIPTALTLGADRALTKKALDTVGAPGAGAAYAQHQEQLSTAHPELQTAGELIGFGAAAYGSGGAAGAARAIPGIGVSALGGAAEAGVARALGGLAARGALGRAATTGASLAARGAVEGAAYAGAEQATQNILNDAPVGEKLYGAIGHGAVYGGALGGALGFSGSLAASGVRGAASGLRGAADRALELASGGVKAEEAALPSLASDTEGAFAKPKAATAKSVLQAPDDAARRLSNQLAVDALYATKTQARDALEHVAGGADAVGEYINRQHIKPSGDGGGLFAGSAKAGAAGRADQLLESIQKDKAARIAPELSGAIKETPARFDLRKLEADTFKMYNDMLADPTRIAGAESFKNRVVLEISALANTPGRIATDGTIDAADAFYTRAALEKGAYEVTRTSTAAGVAYKQILRKWDAAIIDTIDDAAAKAGKGGAKDRIKHWKREWQLASAAEEMAQGGAERVLRNNIFGIREGIGAAAGLATGHPIAGALALVGGKLARERGSAAAAYALGHLADSGAIGRAVQRLNGKVSSAAKAVLTPAPQLQAKGVGATSATRAAEVAVNKEDVALTHKKAQDIIKWMGAVRANPERMMSQLEEAGAMIGHTAGPNAAAGYTTATLKAISFIAGHIPVKERRDPLNPRSVPPLTYDEADRLVRAATYATKPETVWDDFAKLKVTPEGLRAAKTFQPTSFEEFQDQLQEHVEDHLLHNRLLTQTQRLQIDKLLGYGLTPKPSAVARLQANLQAPQEPPPAPGPSGPPLDLKVQQTGFDAVEARKSTG